MDTALCNQREPFIINKERIFQQGIKEIFMLNPSRFIFLIRTLSQHANSPPTCLFVNLFYSNFIVFLYFSWWIQGAGSLPGKRRKICVRWWMKNMIMMRFELLLFTYNENNLNGSIFDRVTQFYPSAPRMQRVEIHNRNIFINPR